MNKETNAMVELDLDTKKCILEELNKLCKQDYDYLDLQDENYEEVLSKFGEYTIEEVECLPVEDEGKYQYGGTIYQVCLDKQPTDMYFMQTWSRSGSYFSDYYYSFDELQPCEQITRVIKDWKVFSYE